MATDPKARAREAFSDLDTPEKTAFVIEATFSTIGAALRETGERLGSILTDFDPEDFFRAPAHRTAEPPPEAKAAAAKKPAATRTRASGAKAAGKKATPKTSTRPKTTGTKTAGRSRKKKDGDS